MNSSENFEIEIFDILKSKILKSKILVPPQYSSENFEIEVKVPSLGEKVDVAFSRFCGSLLVEF